MVKRKVYFTLDCAKPGNQYTVEGLHVGDKRSCEFHILLRNGIVPLSFDDENIAVIINAQKPDGTTISTLCDISEDKKEVVYTLNVQDTTVAGIVNYELIIAAYDGENYCILYSATFSTVVSTGVIVPVFRELDSEPADWATGYKKYFRRTQNGYEKITDDTCPAFDSDNFYFLVNPNYDSENDYAAFEQTVANVRSLLLRVGAVEAKNAEQDTTIGGKAAADHTHSEYLTAQDISGKEDKSNKFSTIKRSQGEGENSGYPSVYAVRKFLQDYYYSKTEIDDTTYTKGEVNTALAEKAAANHTHSEYVTDSEMQEALANIDVDFDNRFELHLSVAFDENGVPVKWDDKATYGAGAFSSNKIVTAFVASNVTRLGGGTFAGCPNLTDVYIDNVEGAITIVSGAIRDGATVHYKGEFNAVGFIVRAMKYFEGNKADKANVYTKSEVDVALAGKAAANHTHSEYVTSSDISGKMNKLESGAGGKLIQSKEDGDVQRSTYDVSNSYNDILDMAISKLPTCAAVRKAMNSVVPTYTSDLQNDSGFVTEAEMYTALDEKADSSDIPTKTSDLTNDSGFLTQHQDISGKEDKANKASSFIFAGDGEEDEHGNVIIYDHDAFYPSVKAVEDHLDLNYYTKSQVNTSLASKENTSARVTSISSSSTNSQYPTAKAVYDKIRSEIQTAIGGIENGSQIVSGVVNQNGTITFTDSDGNTFTTTGSSVIGADGFSPTATVTQTASGATVSITDSTGTTTANISNGADGQDYVLTSQDKTDIANIVLQLLPTTQGVLYGNTSN